MDSKSQQLVPMAKNTSTKNTSTKNPSMEENYDLVDNVRKWVAIDTQMKKVNEKMREFRDKKHELSQSICSYAERHDMKDTKIDISDGVLRFAEKRDYSPLTFSYIETALKQIISNESQVSYIIQYLRDNREVKVSREIRRTYK